MESFMKSSKQSKRSVSKLAQKVLDFLQEEHVFPAKVLSEVPLHKINARAPRNLYVDILVQGICAMEVDGPQHKVPVRFGGISLAQAEENLDRQKTLDRRKELFIRGSNLPLIRLDENEVKEISFEMIYQKLEIARKAISHD